MTSYAIPLWDMPAVPVTGGDALFPVRHVYCVTRNYDPRAAEPGDIIFTGTPEGETVVGKGDDLVGEIEGIGRLSVTIT